MASPHHTAVMSVEYNELLTRFDEDGDVRTKTDVSFYTPFDNLPI